MSPQQQQHQHGGAPEEITNGMSGVCGCCNNGLKPIGSFCLALFCPCVAYGQNRERAGLQPCFPAALSLAIPLMIIALSETGIYIDALLYEDVFEDIRGDTVRNGINDIWLGEAIRKLSLSVVIVWGIGLLLGILLMVIFAILLGPTRSNVQRITGVADGGCANYILGGCCSPCILAQEHRIIERKWRANNEQPLSSGLAIMPVATMPSSVAALVGGAE
jgi:Cys-rich protein (TIGR01571 family)